MRKLFVFSLFPFNSAAFLFDWKCNADSVAACLVAKISNLDCAKIATRKISRELNDTAASLYYTVAILLVH